MGEVYRARDHRLDREVALKVLPDGLVNDPERLARFDREAKTLASLNHPNIAQIYGVEEAGSMRALVLELVEGPTLADVIHGRSAAETGLAPQDTAPSEREARHAAGGASSAFTRGQESTLEAERPRSRGGQRGGEAPRGLEIDEALPIARQIADALESAHEQGIIHRDLKPANIKLRPDGVVKVLDFGLAKMLEPGRAGEAGRAGGAGRDVAQGFSPAVTNSPTITTPAMTQMGVILGTAAYMSPEQAKGRPADKRSDVWAFGCVLYEMLTGRRALEGEDVSDTLAAVLRGEPDWSIVPQDVPTPIRTLIQRCLTRDGARRITDIAVAKFLLNEAGTVGTSASITPPTSAQSRLKTTLLIGAGSVLGAVAASAVLWSSKPSTPPALAARFSIELPEGQTFSGVSRQFVAISHDGTKLVYVANARLYLRSIGDLEARPIPGTESHGGLVNPVFSPDGESIAFFLVDDNTIRRIAVTGGTAVTLCRTAGLAAMSWGDDGIVFAQNRGSIANVEGTEGGAVLRVSPNGGAPEQLITLNRGEFIYGQPQMLPSIGAVLFTLIKSIVAVDDRFERSRTERVTSEERAEIVVQSLKGGKRTTLVNGGDGRYLPSGHLVYAVGGVVFAVPFNVRQHKITGPPVPVLEGVRRSVFGNGIGAAQFSVSDNGTVVYVSGPTSISERARTLFVADRNGSRTPLPVPAGPYLHPRVSRDGKLLAVENDDGKEANVFIYDLSATSAIRRLTFGGRNRFPVWSPDGRRVAFQSNRDGDLAIFEQRADGSALTRLTKPDGQVSHMPETWSPDGRTLLFSVVQDRTFSLWALTLADGKVNPFGDVHSAEPINASFSPDGRWVAYTTNDRAGGTPSPNRGVYVQPFPAIGTRHQVPQVFVDFHPAWGPSGKELFFIPTSSRFVVVGVETVPNLLFGRASFLPPLTTDRISIDVKDYDVMPDGRFVSTMAAEQSGPGTTAAPQIRVVFNWFEELKARAPVK
jgi:serine/threonine-protein kinase